jgi:hypothetical protein
MNRSIFIAFVLICTLFVNINPCAHAQAYDWNLKPILHAVPEQYKKESAIFILDMRHIKYVPDEAKNEIWVHRTLHRIIRLLDDKGVELFNTMTVGAAAGAEIINIKARTVKKDGTVHPLDKGSIKTNTDQNGMLQYHVAFEGVAPGDEVEIYYTEKRGFAVFGSEIMQFGLPVAKSKFRLETPEYLVYQTKGYNSFPTATDTLIESTRYYNAEQSNIDGREEEPYSDVMPNVQRLEYKLLFSGESNSPLYTWNDLAKRIYELNYTFDDKEQKAVDKFLAGLKLQNLTEEEKIKAIEAAIKKSVVLNDELSDPVFSQVNHILEKKTASEIGLVRLHTACYTAAGIAHELGLTCNRFQAPLDPAFENWNRLDIYLIHFPTFKQFLMPSATSLRYPVIPVAARENKAVFCKVTTIGKLTSAVASLRDIPALPMDESQTNIEAHIRFDEAMSPLLQIRSILTGYGAFSIREVATVITADKEADLVQSLVPCIDNKDDIKSYKIINRGLEHYSDNKPLEIAAEVLADNLLEKAGQKYLLKIGEVLGPQAQMYQESERKLPINMPFAHKLVRDITVEIPAGYRVVNPEVINMNITDEAKSMGFISGFKTEGNKMSIHVNEYYSKTAYPASEINAFRKVINAAADFNKVVLVLERE